MTEITTEQAVKHLDYLLKANRAQERERKRDKKIADAESANREFYSRMLPKGYIAGLGRDYPHPRLAHLYKGDIDDPGLPMCKRGWNRDNGTSYSIWRNNYGRDGICTVCVKRAFKGLDGVKPKEYQDYEGMDPEEKDK